MPCISTKRNYRRKKTVSGGVKKTIVHQAERTGMNTAKHQASAERDIESQNIIGGQQHSQGQRTAQEA
jgi:hypothetical protein